MAEAQTSERVVAGRYRLIEPLGRGGMGTVWRAVDQVLEREVAVKELHQSAEMTGTERDVFTIRTFREARAAGRLSHPNVAAVYDAFEEGGYPWIVLELIPSRTLGSVIREEGPLPPRRAAEIGSSVLAALRVAHANGVLHRDVKPDNVLLADDGRVVLTDFGIAAMEDDSPVTSTGMLVGTPAFIAPERAAGRQAQRASDLWSLGVTLFMAVEGRSPFHRGHALATLAAVMYEEPGPLHRAGPLAPVIEGLLIKDPARRMTEDYAAQHLHAVATGQVTGPVVPRPRQPPRLARLMPSVDGFAQVAPTAGHTAGHTAGRTVGPTGGFIAGPTGGRTGARTPAPASLPAPAPVVVSGRPRSWALAAGSGALVALVGLAAGAFAFATARAPADARGTAVVSTPTVTVFTTKTAEAAGTGKNAGKSTGTQKAEETVTRPVANTRPNTRPNTRRGALGARGDERRQKGQPNGKANEKKAGKAADKPSGGAKNTSRNTTKPTAAKSHATSGGGGTIEPSQGKGHGKGKSSGKDGGAGKGEAKGKRPGDGMGAIPDGLDQSAAGWQA